MIITIASTESAQAVARVRKMLDATVLHDIDFNGVSFDIQRGDFTAIDDADDEDATTLFSAVRGELAGERDSGKTGWGLTANGVLYEL